MGRNGGFEGVPDHQRDVLVGGIFGVLEQGFGDGEAVFVFEALEGGGDGEADERGWLVARDALEV